MPDTNNSSNELPKELSLEALIDKIRKYNPNGDLSMVEKAYNLAVKLHEGQRRVSGEPYAMHPISVANIIADMELDVMSISAALLHDVVEDTEYTKEQVAAEFGDTVALLVDGVTKLGKIPYTSKEEEQVENLRKMFLAMAKDIRVIVIKLADRLHNMRTMKAMSEKSRRENARETLQVYAPLAHRLGMSKIKIELEDLSLRYIDPVGYYEIVEKIAQKRSEREKYISSIIDMIDEELKNHDIKAYIAGRAKHFYSIYRKMIIQGKTIDELYDLFAVRVIVDSVEECYTVLGIVHNLFKPMPGRLKDYISLPKPNMYQSLHTTVIALNGTPLEIQIRTWDMHHTAENGIAAHWKYKEGKSGESELDAKLEWVKQLLEIQKDMTNTEDFMNTLKIDMFSDEVFVFTPRGDVINLPAGSTPIDFAYAIHSAVGNKTQGAKVNSKIVTLDYVLQNGDIVEIITSPNVVGPNLDWLKIVKTSQAKNKISQWFKKENREENIVKGKEILDKELKKIGVTESLADDNEFMDPLLKKYGFKQKADFYATLGYGGATAGKLLSRLKEEGKKRISSNENPTVDELIQKVVNTKRVHNNHSSSVSIEGIDNCLIRFSHCCNPVPGDDIIGYVTRGRGVAIHRKDCINITNMNASKEEQQRFINVSWNDETEKKGSFQALICLTATDRSSLLLDVTKAIDSLSIPVKGLLARTGKNDIAILDITLETQGAAELDNTIKSLKKIKGVLSVVRRRQ